MSVKKKRTEREVIERKLLTESLGEYELNKQGKVQWQGSCFFVVSPKGRHGRACGGRGAYNAMFGSLPSRRIGFFYWNRKGHFGVAEVGIYERIDPVTGKGVVARDSFLRGWRCSDYTVTLVDRETAMSLLGVLEFDRSQKMAAVLTGT